jgi:hypothetical protein
MLGVTPGITVAAGATVAVGEIGVAVASGAGVFDGGVGVRVALGVAVPVVDTVGVGVRLLF